MVFNPRPFHLQSPDPKALENPQCNLLNVPQPVGMLNIIVPSLDSIQHDHCYYSPQEERTITTQELKPNPPLPNNIVLQEERIIEEDTIRTLTLTTDERNKLEESTRTQSATSQ